ncbi:MAG: 2-amino-4-hydroxy-6-hydroxymethyldihydropteridine diphosphokinase [Muribaculaceae bacterium]|nr:2-amino-4-hydroxy-6-hydroxymethyldihydropteridine diphosphokinase [Muribaculaceae bacterium]
MTQVWPIAHVNIGSNIGDRAQNIDRAVALIASSPAVAPGKKLKRSDIYISQPWGYASCREYYNLAISFPTPLTPLHLHRLLQALQHSIDPAPHRDEQGNYIDRKIDIDLIAVDNIIVNTPELQLPHPRMHLRHFVLAPMAQLAPSWLHPILHKTVTHLLATTTP